MLDSANRYETVQAYSKTPKRLEMVMVMMMMVRMMVRMKMIMVVTTISAASIY